MLRFLAATRLTVLLCLALALVGAAGSVLYEGSTAAASRGAASLFRSAWFLVPSLLLLLNVAACVFSKLRARAYRGVRLATFLGLHAGLALMAAGMAADGRYSFVATQVYRIGEPTASHFDWRAGADRRFPFRVEVLGVEERYHPILLQVGVRDAAGRKHGPFRVREGVRFEVPGTGISVTPRAFDPKEKVLTFDATDGALPVAGARAGVGGAPLPGGASVVPVAWADPEVAEYVARIRFLPPAGPPEPREIRVNRPASFGGFTFCLSTTRAAADGSRIVGLQVTREPGAPWFWGGAALFGASLLARFLRRGGRRAAPEGEPLPGEGAAGPPAAASLLAALLLCALPGGAWAFGRSIAADERWSGEVKVLEPVTVEKGATLTILPGTTVLLSGDVRSEAGGPDGGIRVYGRLRVEGEPGRPVRFARLHPARPWNEIFFKDAEAVVRNATVEGALWGLHIHDGDVRVERTTLRGNGGGARLRGTGARFDRCEIRDNDIGMRFWEGGPVVTGSSISGNRIGLFYRDGAGGGKISGSTISNREVDVKVGDWARGDLDLSGNRWAGRPKVRDFRNPGQGGKIRFGRALRRPPAAGAE
jgi:hypothetical protein